MKRSLFCKHSTRHFDDSFSMRNSLFLTAWETVVSQESFIIDVSGGRFRNKQSSCWTELTWRLVVPFSANHKKIFTTKSVHVTRHESILSIQPVARLNSLVIGGPTKTTTKLSWLSFSEESSWFLRPYMLLQAPAQFAVHCNFVHSNLCPALRRWD